MSEKIIRGEQVRQKIREMGNYMDGVIILNLQNKGDRGISLDDAILLLDSSEIFSDDSIFSLRLQGPPNDDAGTQHDHYLYTV